VIVGESFDLSALDAADGLIRRADAAGTAVFEGALGPTQMVTVTSRCYQPLTIVDVPVDTVTAELALRPTADCGRDAPVIFGGSPSEPVVVRGELVWRGGVELQRAEWTNVPVAQLAGERRAAYVLELSYDPEGSFRLPRERDAITADSPGLFGYEFELVTGAGTRDYYAIAGIENRNVSPPRFAAYAMGLVRGVRGEPGDTIEQLSVAMNRTLDQPLQFDVLGPTPSGRGPDRIDLRVSVEVTPGGYALLPNAWLDVALPADGRRQLIGLPALVGDLTGARYVVGARAVSGSGASPPSSTLPLIEAAEASAPIAVRGFVPIPSVDVGSDAGLRWQRRLAVAWTPAERAVDLLHYSVISGGGLVTWTVVAPASAPEVQLPDLSRLPEGDLLPGPLSVVASLASVPDLDYSALRSTQLRRFAWEAYAVDVATARHAP
jgi:hypothetical protein